MEERTRILLCEDDESLGMLLREYLQQKGFNADLFADDLELLDRGGTVNVARNAQEGRLRPCTGNPHRKL